MAIRSLPAPAPDFGPGVVGACVLGLAAWACSGAPEEPVVRGERVCAEIRVERIPPNASVIVVINDTMRRDRVGAYGGPAQTKRFDAFSEEFLLFENAIAPAPWTKPSVASLFTSLHPSQHRVASDPGLRRGGQSKTLPVDLLSEDFLTLAEVLQEAGYRTAAIISNPWLEKRHGFAQGFDLYDESFAGFQVPGEMVTQAALEWLATVAENEPFFLYVHYIDSHRPYGPLRSEDLEGHEKPDAYQRRVLPKEAHALVRKGLRTTAGQPLPPEIPVCHSLIELAYDRGLEEFDSAFGLLLDGLRAGPVWERTALFVTSDHGEALFRRGYGNHGAGLYDDELAIPLAARIPGAAEATARISCTVSLIDMMPTICAYLGLQTPSSAMGWSFIDSPAARPVDGRRFVVSEGTMVDPRHRTIRDRDFKLVFEPRGTRDMRIKSVPFSLFDLNEDPTESVDVAEQRPRNERYDRILTVMGAALEDAVPPYRAPEKTYEPADPELYQRLKELGYVGDD